MNVKLRSTLSQLWIMVRAALGAFFLALPAWFRTRYMWPMLLVPAVWGVVVYQLEDADVIGWHNSAICQDIMEIVHPALLLSGALIAISGWGFVRDGSLAFLSVMCAFVVSREFGGQGTSLILYAGLVGLITYGHMRPGKIATLLESRFACSLMATCFLCYVISQLFDRGIIKRLGWLLTWDTSWKPPYSTQIEETMESVGGAFLLLAVLATLYLALRHRSHGDSDPNSAS
jgi:hypothetical protein